MRINFEEPAKAHLTLPKHELAYVSIWNTVDDIAYLRVDGHDYLYVEGTYYDGCINSEHMWHPGQLIINASRLAKTKARKLVKEQTAYFTECEDPCPAPTPVEFPAHLTLTKGERKAVTAFHKQHDLVSFNRNGNHVLRIYGIDYATVEQRGGAAGYIEWWDALPEGELMREIAKFIKFSTKI